ncbi:MAG: hypothetical protein IJZ39_13055 [Oscillospiraceae bacterium]|nr:hypothetical protein [Oscillospiraceae bacterium]
MNEPTCADCAHFRRHYIRFDDDTPACVHFRQKETAGNPPGGLSITSWK